jgi:hypothetical protein
LTSLEKKNQEKSNSAVISRVFSFRKNWRNSSKSLEKDKQETGNGVLPIHHKKNPAVF